MSKTIQELAKEYSLMFVHAKRDDGKEFVKTYDERPEELHNLIMEAHGDMMPDDYRYEFIESCLDIIADSPDDDLDSPQIEPYIYTFDLLSWLASRNDRYSYVDDAVEEFGHADSIIKDIMNGQVKEKEEVYFSVLNSLREIVEEMNEEEETEE